MSIIQAPVHIHTHTNIIYWKKKKNCSIVQKPTASTAAAVTKHQMQKTKKIPNEYSICALHEHHIQHNSETTKLLPNISHIVYTFDDWWNRSVGGWLNKSNNQVFNTHTYTLTRQARKKEKHNYYYTFKQTNTTTTTQKTKGKIQNKE